MRSGVASLAKSLSRELASEGFCVNNLAPGTINTDRPGRSIQNAGRQSWWTYRETVGWTSGYCPAGPFWRDWWI